MLLLLYPVGTQAGDLAATALACASPGSVWAVEQCRCPCAHRPCVLPNARSIIKPFGDADMQISVVEYGPAWQALGGTRFAMPHSFFNPHDFAITATHYIFFQVGALGGLIWLGLVVMTLRSRPLTTSSSKCSKGA